ncbi:hypothetical protein G6F57_017227 [Rhizopus arrhizus]|nr:hypothetical protein G6F57_017227 [Rhizopus arrhizus]
MRSSAASILASDAAKDRRRYGDKPYAAPRTTATPSDSSSQSTTSPSSSMRRPSGRDAPISPPTPTQAKNDPCGACTCLAGGIDEAVRRALQGRQRGRLAQRAGAGRHLRLHRFQRMDQGRWARAPADPPPGHGIGLGHAVDDQRAASQVGRGAQQTAPVGLLGEFRISHLVRGVIASRKASGVSLKPSSACVATITGTPPLMRTAAGNVGQYGAGTMTSSPSSRVAFKAR